MSDNRRDDVSDIREMAQIADRLARRMNRNFVLDEAKVQAYQSRSDSMFYDGSSNTKKPAS